MGEECTHLYILFRTRRTGPDMNFSKQGSQLSLHLGKVEPGHVDGLLGNDHEIQRKRNQVLVQTKEFPDHSFDPVATHGLAHLLADGESEAPHALIFRTFQNDEDEIRGKITTAPIITLEKMGPFRYATFLGKG